MILLFLGRSMWGAERLTGPNPGTPTHMVPPFFILGWKIQNLSKGGSMKTKGKDEIKRDKLLRKALKDLKAPNKKTTPLPATNKNMQDIESWISLQYDPDLYWSVLKLHLKRIEPDFKEYVKGRLKKRAGILIRMEITKGSEN